MRAEQVAKQARDAISRYCLEECPAYCCRKGSISLTAKEMTLLVGADEQALIQNHILVKVGDKYSFKATFDHGCPKLRDNKCTIHDNPDRPLVCRNYPLFISGKTINLSSSCFAVKTSILYPYIRKFRQLGYTISD
jgi:Fe-S-cluster containining protein